VGQRRAARVLGRGLAHLEYAGNALVSAILAPHCATCARVLDTPLDGPVCPACWAAIRPLQPPLCVACGDPLPSWRVISRVMSVCARCRRRSFRLKPEATGVDRSRSGGEYEGALRDIIHAFKYDGRRSLAVPLAGIMRTAGDDLLRDADVIVPVPLHAVRRLRRGFNQASDLARRLDHPVVNALWRVRATSPQAGLTAAARRRNVRRAFRLSPLLSRRTRSRFIDTRIVVLVDDVSTTGATLDACARVLKEAGAREVRALTAGRALRQP
jgi:ComF family protein